MALLIVFGFLAGAATALSPCVLPILPVVLSAGASGGRRRPAGIVCGLALSFTFAAVALVYVIDALGLPDSLMRNLAIAVLAVFGVSLIFPAVAARIEAWLSRFTGRAARSRGDDGFWGGSLLGASLGLVYAPCAGPILAGVITVSASQPLTAGRLAVALSYGIGSAMVLYALMLGGRRLIAPLSRRSPRIQAAMGAVMLVFAFAMYGEYDLRFQNAIAADLPAIVVNPTGEIESSAAAEDALAEIRQSPETESGTEIERGLRRAERSRDHRSKKSSESGLPVIAPAPEFTGTQRWFNTLDGEPLTLRSLRGRVVLVDFWTYSCINCIRTQPYLKAWDSRYRRRGLTIVGVHTPEFPFERDAANVAAAIERAGLEYPVVQDNEYETWNAYANRYWPAAYFIDAEGQIRYAHFGEGDYEKKEQVIRDLLAEAGRSPGGGLTGADGETISDGVTTPESYLGSYRADRFTDGPISSGLRDFGVAEPPPPDHLSYGGVWRIDGDMAVARGRLGRDGRSRLALEFGARRVFLVLGSPGRPREVRLRLDGRPIEQTDAGQDVDGLGRVQVNGQRLYRLVDLSEAGRHRLLITFEPGAEAYAFTFG